MSEGMEARQEIEGDSDKLVRRAYLAVDDHENQLVKSSVPD